MTREAKLNAVAVCFLAALFYCLFMFAKHNAYLASMIPFGDDPYDSVGSFACVVGALLALVALARAYLPYRSGPDRWQLVYLVRSQLAVVLAVFLTVAADATAMARYPEQWYPGFWNFAVVAVVAGMAIAATSIFLLMRPLLPPKTDGWRQRRMRALLLTLGGMAALAACPKSMLRSMAPHLFAIILGAAVLFASMRMWLVALVPDEGREENAERPESSRGVWQRWAGVMVLGGLVGLSAFVGELTERGPAIPMRRLLFVEAVFAGIGLSGILLAYLFLGEPLGFRPRS